MSKPLHLFIDVRYDPDEDHPGNWQKRIGYGQQLPAPLRLTKGELAEVIVLEANPADARLYAAATGYLSTRFPDNGPADPHGELPPADLARPDPDRLNIYLRPRPFLDLEPGFLDRCNQLLQGTTSPAAIPTFLNRPTRGAVEGFLYLNVDTASLKSTMQVMYTAADRDAALRPHTAIIPAGASDIEFEQIWQHFLNGRVDVFVRKGNVIADSAEWFVATDNKDNRQIGFGVLTSHGTVDPAHFYEWMRDFVQPEAKIDAFLQMVPVQWPLIDESLNVTGAIKQTEEHLFPYSTLLRLKDNPALSSDNWRVIGNNQKALYRQRLLRRVGQAAAPSGVPAFEFNDLDWQNPFQLEAVAEFYVNFDDPWDVAQEPRDPDDDDYKTLNFMPLSGTEATVNGNTVVLDGDPDLDDIWVGRDSIFLPESGNTARIVDVDPDSSTLTVDDDLPANAGVIWRINRRPILVLIDSYGGRLSGEAARSSTPHAADPFRPTGADTLVLDGVTMAQMQRIRAGFTNIYLHADEADRSMQPRTYTITAVDVERGIVTLDGSPELPDDGSSWLLPAGVGGDLRVSDNLTLQDDYDGTLFVVHNGEVRRRYRWTSYTSRRGPNVDLQSSVRGNRQYYFASYKSGGSGGAFRNFSFMVVDASAYLTGRQATVSAARTVTLPEESDLNLLEEAAVKLLIFLYNDKNNPIQGFWIDSVDADNHTVSFWGTPDFDGDESAWRVQVYDGVHEARHYFKESVTEDRAPADELPGPGGKQLIRLHYGSSTGNYSGSDGCEVSPYYYDMRNFLISLYQHEHRAMQADGAEDADIAEIAANATHAANVADFGSIDAGNWNNKIVGTLWLIRPDERPLG